MYARVNDPTAQRTVKRLITVPSSEKTTNRLMQDQDHEQVSSCLLLDNLFLRSVINALFRYVSALKTVIIALIS